MQLFIIFTSNKLWTFCWICLEIFCWILWGNNLSALYFMKYFSPVFSHLCTKGTGIVTLYAFIWNFAEYFAEYLVECIEDFSKLNLQFLNIFVTNKKYLNNVSTNCYVIMRYLYQKTLCNCICLKPVPIYGYPCTVRVSSYPHLSDRIETARLGFHYFVWHLSPLMYAYMEVVSPFGFPDFSPALFFRLPASSLGFEMWCSVCL